MVLKSIKHGVKVYGPPYTKAEEREFYSRNARGPSHCSAFSWGTQSAAEVPETAAAVAGKRRHMMIAGGYKGYVLRLRRDKNNTRILEIFGPACSDFALSTATTVAEAKSWIDDYIDLEQTIDELAYRKRIAPIDSAEWTLANNALIVLRYSCEEAGGIIEDLDFDWGSTCRPLAATPATESRQVLPFRRAGE